MSQGGTLAKADDAREFPPDGASPAAASAFITATSSRVANRPCVAVNIHQNAFYVTVGIKTSEALHSGWNRSAWQVFYLSLASGGGETVACEGAAPGLWALFCLRTAAPRMPCAVPSLVDGMYRV